MATSNAAEMTRDLANRSFMVRINKQPADYAFIKWPEGDLLEHVKSQQSYYLGCIFSVIRAWVAAGKPEEPGNHGHDFRQWAGIVTWIAKNLLHVPAPLEGHEATQ